MDTKLEELLNKLRTGTISDQEKAALDEWYLEESSQKTLPQLSFSEAKEDLKQLESFSPTNEDERKRSNSFYWSAAAAVFLVALLSMLYLVRSDFSQSSSEIVVGGNKAKLTLANGDVIDLEGVDKNGSVVIDGATIYKTDEGTIIYEPNAVKSAEETYDEISTPRGGEFKLVLVDGTQVWLNANSSLKFFSNMQGSKREVWLKGEAYFEVAHNEEKPFIVKSEQQNIRVLGTKFNVRANSRQSQTTLIEGSVSLQSGKIKLEPGQQLTTTGGVDEAVANVDIEAFLAWKEGYFLFNNEPLSDVMDKIADWYDIEVEFKDNVQTEKIWATVSKYRDIKEVLKMIELTETAHFSIKGRRVVVTK